MVMCTEIESSDGTTCLLSRSLALMRGPGLVLHFLFSTFSLPFHCLFLLLFSFKKFQVFGVHGTREQREESSSETVEPKENLDKAKILSKQSLICMLVKG
ncbi:hypothetical protein GQ457_05G009440 [Hibiscus cannabinus]